VLKYHKFHVKIWPFVIFVDVMLGRRIFASNIVTTTTKTTINMLLKHSLFKAEDIVFDKHNY